MKKHKKIREDPFDRISLDIALNSELWVRKGCMSGSLHDWGDQIRRVVKVFLAPLPDDVRMTEVQCDAWLKEVLPQAAAMLGVSVKKTPLYLY